MSGAPLLYVCGKGRKRVPGLHSGLLFAIIMFNRYPL